MVVDEVAVTFGFTRSSMASSSELKSALDQDDLYVEMTLSEVMDRVSLDATTEQYGAALKTSSYSLWHANLAARRLRQSGRGRDLLEGSLLPPAGGRLWPAARR